MLFLRTLHIVTAINTELLIVCKVALQCLFVTACVAVSGVILTRWRVNFSVKITAIIYNITSFTITNSAWAIKIMECRGKLQSNNQVIASQNWVTLKLVGNLVFSVRWRRRSQLIGAPAVKNTRRTTADSLKPAQTTTPHAGAQRKPTAPYRQSRCC